VIVVKLDGYNPRTRDEKYPRPWNIGPVETDRQFPFYFQELAAYIDANYRTKPDRDHRATAGLSMGGFMSFWVAGKFPQLVSSASNFMGSSEFVVGHHGLEVEYRHDEMSGNYNGVRTRLVTGTKDFIQFYHRRMNAIWLFTAPDHQTEDIEFDHGTPKMAKTLDFHMHAFANPLPKPALWNHIDIYPFFDVWGWNVASNRRSPGFTVLANVSKSGFRSSVREWVPSGPVLPKVKLSIATDRIFPPRSLQTVTIVRLRDGKVFRSPQKVDADGRLNLELDGEDQEVGISGAGVPALTGYRVESEPWATVRHPVKLRARFWNKGAATLAAQTVRWETANPSVVILEPVAKLPSLAPSSPERSCRSTFRYFLPPRWLRISKSPIPSPTRFISTQPTWKTWLWGEETETGKPIPARPLRFCCRMATVIARRSYSRAMPASTTRLANPIAGARTITWAHPSSTHCR
jgi:hypothetical protein